MDALNKIRALTEPATTKTKEEKEPVPQTKWKTSLPILMSGNEYNESTIPDAPVKDDLPENLLFDRPVNKIEWSGIKSYPCIFIAQ